MNNEIILLDGRVDGTFHGHVRDWNELSQKHKNILINKFDFTVKGSPSKFKK